MSKPRWVAGIAAFNLALAVAVGAFGAHALRSVIDEGAMAWFKTGHDYHMWHGLGVLAVVLGVRGWKSVGAWSVLMLVGTVLFSGSLYLMAVTGMRWLGAITPLGGASWIGGWIWLGVSLSRKSLSE